MDDLLPLDPDQLLTTTRAVRKRLDLTRPVEREVIEQCINVAVQAPSGSNRQTWQWVPVDDAATRAMLGDIYREVFDQYAQSPPSATYQPGDARYERRERVNESAQYLRDHIHEVPVLTVVYVEGRHETLAAGSVPGFWGSVIPAVWSFMLALRARGLGSVWTTMTCRREKEVGELLGVPHEQFTQVGMYPVAYTRGTDFKPAPRVDVASRIHWNAW